MMKLKKSLVLLISILFVVAIFCGCGKSENGDGTVIRIAAKDFTEQYILGEILKQLVEGNTDFEVELTSGIAGETSIIMPAMERGDFDLYAEYDSTAWMTVLKKAKEEDLTAMHEELNQIYNDEYDMCWLGYYGFDNGYGIVVRRDTATKYELQTFSDLAKNSDQLVFGAGYEFFEREDGYDGLKALYDVNFKDIEEMNLSLKYSALLDGQVDAITVYKTDGRMLNKEIVALEDDKGYFPPAMCGTIIRNEVLEAYPELGTALSKLNDAISNEEMQKMNGAVDLDGADPVDVAKDFLVKKGLIVDE